MPAFSYKVVGQGTFRNNRLYAAGEIIPSDKVLISRALEPMDEVTRVAVEQKKRELAAAKAATPEEQFKLISELKAKLAAYEAKDLAEQLAKREAAEAKPAPEVVPVPAPKPAPQRAADRR